MKRFWARLLGRGDDTVADPANPESRRLPAENFEDRQADEFVEEHLGGIDPNRLLPDDRPPREDRL